MATASRANAVACRASPLASRASICRNRMLAGDVSSSVAESRSLARSVRSPLRIGGSTTCAGNSITTARIDHRSGAASRALGLTAVGATIIKPPLRWRNRASRRSLSNNSSWSHAAVQGPGSSSDPGESSRTASTQTSPFAAIAGSNSACTMEPNSFGVAGKQDLDGTPPQSHEILDTFAYRRGNVRRLAEKEPEPGLRRPFNLAPKPLPMLLGTWLQPAAFADTMGSVHQFRDRAWASLTCRSTWSAMRG